ncbi:MAG: hypothetical protein ACPKPY_14255 [Nitrososphaeraceae archaeon]
MTYHPLTTALEEPGDVLKRVFSGNTTSNALVQNLYLKSLILLVIYLKICSGNMILNILAMIAERSLIAELSDFVQVSTNILLINTPKLRDFCRSLQ